MSFKPTLWTKSKNATDQVLEQCWFPGVHSNVGGGYPDVGLSDQPLYWMIEKAQDTGLAFEDECLKKIRREIRNQLFYNSFVPPFNLLPSNVRTISLAEKSSHQGIHESVYHLWNKEVILSKDKKINYRPTNLEHIMRNPPLLAEQLPAKHS